MKGDNHIMELFEEVEQWDLPTPYTIKDKLLFYNKRLYIGQKLQFEQKLLQLLHNSSLGSHLGYDKTIHKIMRGFFWPGLR